MVDMELLAYLESFVSEERKQRFEEVLDLRTRFLTVAIEDIFQMHNSSAVIRTCDVFGVQQAHVIEARFGERLDKNIAMGAQQWVDVARYDQPKECLDGLRDQGYQIVATTPHTDSCYLEDFEFDGPTALFFGTEKEGLSPEVMETADRFLKIPLVGFSESLNVSSAAAIVIQRLAHKLRQSELPWQLTEADRLEKRLDWAQKSIKSVDMIMERFYADKGNF